MTTQSKQKPTKVSVYTDLKFDDILCLYELFSNYKFDIVQIVICDVKDVKGAAKFAKMAAKEFRFQGKLLIARDFHERAKALQHEEIFQVAKCEDPVELSALVPCDKDWLAIQIAPTFGSFSFYKNAGSAFVAMGHNFDASSHQRNICSSDQYKSFTSSEFQEFLNPVMTHNNRGAYAQGHEGGGYSVSQLQFLFDTFPILKNSKGFALSNTNYFKAKQTLKFAFKAGLAEEFGIPDPKSAKKEFEKMVHEWKDNLLGCHSFYYDLLKDKVYPVLLAKQAEKDNCDVKPIPTWDTEAVCMVNPSHETYLDRVFKQMIPGGPGDLLECTDYQQVTAVLRALICNESLFKSGFVSQNVKFGFNEFYESKLTRKALCPQGLKRTDIDLFLEESVENEKKNLKSKDLHS